MTADESSGSPAPVLPGLDPAVLVRGGVRVDVDGSTLWVTLDRPETRNAQTPATWHALRHVGAALEHQEAVRVVVVRGEGPAFSSGLDRRMLGAEPVDGQPPLTALLARSDDEGRVDDHQRHERGEQPGVGPGEPEDTAYGAPGQLLLHDGAVGAQ
jgi:hypothetical protein